MNPPPKSAATLRFQGDKCLRNAESAHKLSHEWANIARKHDLDAYQFWLEAELAERSEDKTLPEPNPPLLP